MSVFNPNSRHLREVLIFCFHSKKTAAEAHQMLSSTYAEAAFSKRTCRKWFQRFRGGDFDVEDRHGGGKNKIFEEEFTESLGVTQQAISKRLKAMGMVQKQGNWVPYELKPRDVERRFFACEQLFQTESEGVFTSHCGHVDGQAEYSRCQGYALHLVGPARSGIMSCCNRVKPS